MSAEPSPTSDAPSTAVTVSVDAKPLFLEAQALPSQLTEAETDRRAFLAACFVALSLGAFVVPLPSLTEVKSDFFGSTKNAALVQSIVDSIGAALNLLLSVPYGRLLERNGRRPFFLAASVANSSALASLVLFPQTPIVFMLASRAAALVQASYAHCYMVDLSADPKVRARYLGYLGGAIAVAFFFAIPAALYPAEKDPFPIFVLGFAVALATVALAWFGIAESPRQPQLSSTEQEPCNPFAGVALLFEARSWGMASAVSILVALLGAGAAEVNLYYLRDVLGLTSEGLGPFLLETGVLTIVVFAVVMPRLLKSLTLSQVLVLSAAASAGLSAVLMVLWTEWPLYVIVVPLTCIAFMATPLAQQIVSEGNPSTLSRRLTALAAMVTAGQVAGSLSFGVLYSQSPDSFKGLPYLVGLITGCSATAVAYRLHQITLASEAVVASTVDPPPSSCSAA